MSDMAEMLIVKFSNEFREVYSTSFVKRDQNVLITIIFSYKLVQ